MAGSMRAQTAVIIVVAFVLSHLAGYLLYSWDRRDALMMTEAIDIAERAAGISRLVRDMAPEGRAEVVRFSDGRAFRVWRSKEPAFEETAETNEETDVLTYLRSQMPRISGNEMRVRLQTSPDRPGIEFLYPPPPLETARPLSRGTASGAVAVSIHHSDGEWLNVLGQINTPSALMPALLAPNLISAALGVALVAFWLVHRVTVPLARMAEAAEKLGKDIHAPPLDTRGPREVAVAAEAFNRMQRRLARLVQNRSDLLAAISHDLRTPLTQLRLRTELMQASVARQKNLRAVDEMEALLDTFLAYARATGETEDRGKVQIGALVASICDDLADLGADVTCEASDGVVLNCRRLSIKRAVANLIDNALKYGTRARVGVEVKGTQVVIRVEDDGPGIPEDQMEMVFKPFHRGDASRTADARGVGLGLGIVQAVAEDHGGLVRLTNRPSGGLLAELVLPR